MTQPRFAAILLAGQRDAVDPLAAHTGAACKALVEIGGEALVLRVLSALGKAGEIDRVLLSGPDAVSRQQSAAFLAACEVDTVTWHPPGNSPSSSAYALMQSLAGDIPVLVTSADLAFPDPARVDDFCRRSLAAAADVTLGLAPYTLVKAQFPDMPKTVLRFADGEYCGCNLFAFMTPEGRRAADYWKAIEDARKSPLKVIRILGWWAVLRYRLGWLRLDDALQLLSKRFGLRIRAIHINEAQAAIDVDSVRDYEIVQRALARGTSSE